MLYHSKDCNDEEVKERLVRFYGEDELMIIRLTTAMLEGLGYTVAAAKTPGEAIAFAREHKGEIHLRLIDVVMPELDIKIRPIISVFYIPYCY